MTKASDGTKNGKAHRGGRNRNGCLQFRNLTWYAVLTVEVEGERCRKWVNLATNSRALAKRKMARVLVQHNQGADVRALLANPETYAELAQRVAAQRRMEGIADAVNEEQRERDWVLPELGPLAVRDITPANIAGVYETARAEGRSQSLVRHLRTVMRSRFAVALVEETIDRDPMDKVRVPRIAVDTRERAVLTDAELVTYLGWTPASERALVAVRQRQTMSALARMFGGLRTGDLHAMRWEQFDVGAFTVGTAPRKKTARPQRIEVPEALRPIIRDWWELSGRQETGLVFPCLRGDRAGEGEKRHVTHAAAFRRDLQAAFRDYRRRHPTLAPEGLDACAPAQGSARWAELFDETELTKPVDFHSWRRAFVQALADVGVNVQTAQKLAGHANLAAHERYLRSSSKLLAIPQAALPELGEPTIAAQGFKYCDAIPSAALPELGAKVANIYDSELGGHTIKHLSQSGWCDLNAQPPAPKAGPLPG